jgi:hypothetical protein
VAISEALASADDLLDQSTDTQLDSMTLTPGAGEYLLIFSASMLGPASAGGEQVTMSVYVNGTRLGHTERELTWDSSEDNKDHICFIACEVNPGASQVVEIKYKKTGSGAINCKNRGLVLLPATGLQEASATADDTTTGTTYEQLDSMNLTPGAGDYLGIFSTSLQGGNNDGPFDFVFAENGTAHADSLRSFKSEQSVGGTDQCLVTTAILSVTAGQVVDIDWRKNATNDTVTCHDRTMVLLPVVSADYSEITAVDTQSHSNTTDAQVNAMTVTPASGDYVAIFSAIVNEGTNAAPGADRVTSIYVGGTQDATSERELRCDESVDNVDWNYFCSAVIAPNGSQAVAAYERESNGGATCDYKHRGLVMVKEAAGGDTSMNAEPTTYAITGKAITETKDVPTNAAPGTYAVTGKDTGQTVAWFMNAEPASYAITGADITSKVAVAHNAEPGSYAITGADIDSQKDVPMNAEPGSYVVTGAAITSHIKMNAEPGSYAVTGLAVTTTVTTPLLGGALPGSYVYTGFDINTGIAITMNAEPGSYTVVGADINSVKNVPMSAEPATYGITGAPVTTTVDVAGVADPGAYALTGADIETQIGTAHEAEPGSYALAGAPITTKINRLTQADPGAYAITGAPATTTVETADEVISADPGAYVVSGAPATTTYTPVGGPPAIEAVKRLFKVYKRRA